MGVDVRWIILLENPHPEGEWKMIEALERREDGALGPRLSTTRDGRVRTLTIHSFARWEKVSSETNPTHRHPKIAKELAEIQEIIGDLPLYYGNDLSGGPGDWLTEDELYELLETMNLADGTFALVADLLAEEAKILGKTT